MASARVIVLDAMGVIYRARDDVAELLVAFVERRGSGARADDVAALYEKASLGHLDADAFWRALDLDPSVEDDYLAGHDLSEGLLSLLEVARIPESTCGACRTIYRGGRSSCASASRLMVSSPTG